MIKNLLNNITHRGISFNMTAHEEKGVIITNYILLFSTMVAFFRIFLFIYADDFNYALISIVASTLFFIGYFLNTKGYHYAAKYILIIIGNVATCYKELMAGGNGGQLYLILAGFGVIFLLFGLSNIYKLIGALLIQLTNVLIITLFPTILAEPKVIDPETATIEKFIGVFSSVLFNVFIIWYFVKKSTDIELKLIENNNILSDYNREISIKNELIKEQNYELESINENLTQQKKIIEDQHQEIISSIEYASKIQLALLPPHEKFKESFRDYMILMKPKDIISGDFYILSNVGNKKVIAVVDCTGHGVPGSMLAMMGNLILNEAINHLRLDNPGMILSYLNNSLTYSLNQHQSSDKSLDGMDIALVVVDKNEKTIQFSGAGRPLYYFVDDENELKYIKSGKFHIGGTHRGLEPIYETHTIQYNNAIRFFLTTDGFTDQMSENNKKYSTGKFKELLIQKNNNGLEEVKNSLIDSLNQHKGIASQRDDICIIGIDI